MANPFEIVKHINGKTELDFDIKEYDPFIINRAFSMMKDTLFIANEVNKMHALDKDQQYQFYFNIVPKGKRFSEWVKADKSSEDLKMLMEHYLINIRVARQYLTLMTESQLDIIREKMMKGGRYGRASGGASKP